MKKWKQTAGFTLVELIVVIAILGILAGVGTVGYSGYIKKANMAADQQLISGIKNAAQLAYTANGFSGAQTVVLSDGAPDFGSDTNENEWLKAALQQAYGEDLSTLTLKYSDWGKGGQVLSDILSHFSGVTNEDIKKILDGTYTPSFANDVDGLFDLIESTATTVGDGAGIAKDKLLQGAADITAGADSITADEFARVWAKNAWQSDILMGAGKGDAYTEDNIDAAKEEGGDKDFLNTAIANAAAIKARNTSIATFLRDNGYPQYYEKISNYNLGNSTIVPQDILTDALRLDMAAIMSGTISSDAANFFNKVGVNPSNGTELATFYAAYTKLTTDYFTSPTTTDITQTQGYKDGLAYYTMMNTVNSVNKTPDDKTNENYYEEMRQGVHLYGQIAQGTVTLDQLVAAQTTLSGLEEGEVAVMIVGDGIRCDVSSSID